VYFIPLPLYISLPAAVAIQFGRFAVVFMDFLNPTGRRSMWPPIIASLATIIALVELGFSIQDMQIEAEWTGARYWSVYLFGSMLIAFGYLLEINFISKGAEAFGMVSGPRTSGATTSTTAPAAIKVQSNGQAKVKEPEPVFFELGLNGNGKH
jgi:hypothetical protein